MNTQAKNVLIILTSSTAGFMGYPLRSPYAAAKRAIIGLCKILTMELGSAGIRVNALCPGALEGERMHHVISSDAGAKISGPVLSIDGHTETLA